MLYPAAGLLLMLGLNLERLRSRTAWSRWLPLWVPVLLLLLVPHSWTGDWGGLGTQLLQIAFALLASAVLCVERRPLVFGATVALALIALLASQDRWLSARSWYPLTSGAVERTGPGRYGATEKIRGTGGNDAAARTWHVSEGVTRLELTMEARLETADDDVPEGENTNRRLDSDDPSEVGMQILGSGGLAGYVNQFYFRPATEWSSFEFDLILPSRSEDGMVQLRPLLAEGEVLATRAVRMTAATREGKAPRPAATRPRQSLWFGEFNLLGHAVATAGIVASSVVPGFGWALPGAGLALTGVLLSGSRAALLALATALTLLAMTALLQRPGRAFRGAALVLAAGAAAALPVAVRSLLELRVHAEISRPEIWSAAWQAFLENPLVGQGLGDFSAHWSQTYGGAGAEAISHAHNLWLHLASSHGVFGLAAAAWLTVGLALLAWRFGRWRGVAIVAPVLLMQVVDTTLLHPGVMFPVLLGLNTLRESGESGGSPEADVPPSGSDSASGL